MRKDLREIEQIDRYLHGRMSQWEVRDFEVRRLCETALQEKIEHQSQAYELVREYGRRKLRQELDTVYRRLLRQPSFRKRIGRIFG